jgi:L-ascorbate metabolism protein UlaG (beta-lactamase superfamily)
MVDPYLSNSVVKYEPQNDRRQKIDVRFLEMTPDVLIFTHDHLDHYDPETAPVFLTREKGITVLCPPSVYKKAVTFAGAHEYVSLTKGEMWSGKELRVTAVKAVHTEPMAIGVLIEELSSGKVYYVTGDTLYDESIFAYLPRGIHAIFLPINGVGGNMNASEASAFAKKVGAKHDVPLHFGMFDDLDGRVFESENRVIPELYKEIKLG